LGEEKVHESAQPEYAGHGKKFPTHSGRGRTARKREFCLSANQGEKEGISYQKGAAVSLDRRLSKREREIKTRGQSLVRKKKGHQK